MPKLSDDYIKSTFDQAVQAFDVCLKITEDQCKDALKSLHIVNPSAAYKLEDFHNARLNMIQALRKGLGRCTIPSFEEWLKMYECPYRFSLKELGLDKTEVDLSLFREVSPDDPKGTDQD